MKILLQLTKNRKILEFKQPFTKANNIPALDLWGNVILTKINTYHRWHHWLCEEGYLVPRCEAPIDDFARHHAYQMLMLQTQYVGPLCC